jgi:hypothetical protein
MKLSRFLKELERYGSDFADWPPADREGAARFARVEPRAAAALKQAAALDALLASRMPVPPAGDAAEALVARLSRMQLPPQERSGLARFLPAILIGSDYTPAWPRMAALAAIAMFGFAFGSLDLVEPRIERAAAPLLFSSLNAGFADGGLIDEDARLP